MRKTVSAARREWPFYVASMAFVLAALTIVWYLALLAPAADSLSLPTPPAETTMSPIPAVVPVATYPTYPTDAHGNVIAVLVTATPEPTWTPMAFVWPTATATPIPTPIMEFSGDMDTGGR
jgi:hypothetical protein